MADDIDMAYELQELHLQKALQEQHKRQNFGGESEEFCVECDDEIPEKRREMLPGVQRCVGCQELLEVKSRQYA